MAQQARGPRVHERWAHLRFSVIGRLLAAPPAVGELRAEIEKLATQEWRHPITGAPIRFSFSTIERWFYQASGNGTIRWGPCAARYAATRVDRSR